MTKNESPKMGGKREGAGRPKIGIESVTVSFRIIEEWREPVKNAVRKEIARLKKKRASRSGTANKNFTQSIARLV